MELCAISLQDIYQVTGPLLEQQIAYVRSVEVLIYIAETNFSTVGLSRDFARSFISARTQ